MSFLEIFSLTPVGFSTFRPQRDLIGIKDGVTVFIEHYEFISIFLFNLLPERLFPGHPYLACLVGPSRFGRLCDDGEIGMGTEGAGGISGRLLHKPSLFGLPE